MAGDGTLQSRIGIGVGRRAIARVGNVIGIDLSNWLYDALLIIAVAILAILVVLAIREYRLLKKKE